MNLLELSDQIQYYVPIALVILFLVFLVGIFSSHGNLKSPTHRDFKGIRLPSVPDRKLSKIFSFNQIVRGVLVIGGAGSGKTKSIIEPLVKQAIAEEYSGILYDFKFPVLANVYYDESLLSLSRVRNCYVNFEDMSRTHRFNVFKIMHNSTYAREYANVFMKNLNPDSIKNDDFFTRTSTAMLAATIVYFNKRHKAICTLPHIISFLLHSDTKKIVDLVSEDWESADMIAPVRSGLGSEKQTAGVISTLQNALSLCSNPKIFWVLSGDDFDLNLNDPESRKLLVIGNNASLSDSISPLISLTISVATKQMNEVGKAKSIILIDEGPTLYIPNFEMIPATARENKIATVYCAQDISQMEDKYGEKKAEVLIGNLANQFYGKVSNHKTADKVVRLFDKEDVEFRSVGRSTSSGGTKNSSSNSNYSLQQRERVTVSHIRDLQPGEFVATTTSVKDFKHHFKIKNKERINLPELTYVTELMIHSNFIKIKEDVESLLARQG